MNDPVADKESDSASPRVSNRLLTVPNVLCFIRLFGSVALVPIALQGHSGAFLAVFLILAATDWLDGKLAVLLDQRSVFGARLDSWADAALYAGLVFGTVVMFGATLRAELPWIFFALLTYVASTLTGFWKYRRWPSYHTRAAKTSWFLTAVAVIALFLESMVWPLRVAVAAVVLTNLEALAITALSPRWQADVPSVYHAWRDRHQ